MIVLSFRLLKEAVDYECVPRGLPHTQGDSSSDTSMNNAWLLRKLIILIIFKPSTTINFLSANWLHRVFDVDMCVCAHVL